MVSMAGSVVLNPGSSAIIEPGESTLVTCQGSAKPTCSIKTDDKGYYVIVNSLTGDVMFHSWSADSNYGTNTCIAKYKEFVSAGICQ